MTKFGVRLIDEKDDTNKNISGKYDTNIGVDSLQKEHRNLIVRLETIQRRRRNIHRVRIQCQEQHVALTGRLNQRKYQRQESVEEYTSLLTRRERSHLVFMEFSQRWNVTNDCFHIWVNGSFATINGCRLGANGPPVPIDLVIDRQTTSSSITQQQKYHGAIFRKHEGENKPIAAVATQNGNHHTNQQHVQQKLQQIRRQEISSMQSTTVSVRPTEHNNSKDTLVQPHKRYFGLFLSNHNAKHLNNVDTNNSNASSEVSVSKLLENTSVPWLEVNASLGHACLLLKLLQEFSSVRGGRSVHFTHELHPMAATSKIGIRFGNNIGIVQDNGTKNNKQIHNITPVIYNLYFEESTGFSFFKNNVKNFNLALQAFLQCIAEAAAQQKDKTIAIPHPIQHCKTQQQLLQHQHLYSHTEVDHSLGVGSNHPTRINPQNFLNGGEWTIGGLSICYPSQAAATGPNGNDATNTMSTLQWNRACKYLLTDLKWLVAYTSKHVDR